jgi:transcriptional regulator of met regulon
MSEEENIVYQKLKDYLQQHSWIILGGEPPGVTNHIPVIEVRDPLNFEKGSKGSKKIVLVAFKLPFFLLLELTASYSSRDIHKLNKLTNYQSAREAFINALLAKELLKSNNIDIDYQQYTASAHYLIKSVGFNASYKFAPEDFITPKNKSQIFCLLLDYLI